MTALITAALIGAHLILGGSDCQVTHVWEDGQVDAVCADGSTWVDDPDGQPYANTAGVPVRAPGWYRVSR